jgi:hypothetical protein
MKSKLTLSVDVDVVERAKVFAREHETSVSSLVEGYLRALAAEDIDPTTDAPLVARLRGIGRSSGGRREYRRHLEEKYAR